MMNFKKTETPPGRPTIAEINLKALEFNYRQVQKRVAPDTKILGVVKADAYGHGALPVSLRLEQLGIEYLGVSIPEEGVELRTGGVKAPILVMGGIFPGDMDRVLQYKLTPVVFQKEVLRRLSREAARKRGKVKIHVKVDTGMTRLGVSWDQWPDFVRELKQSPCIEVEGLLSHYSMSDEEGESITLEQWNRFQEVLTIARQGGVSFRYCHIANSANLVAFPSCSGNLVRPGIMLYGSYPFPYLKGRIRLRPVMTLKTCIHFLRSVPFRTRVSYGGTFVTKRETLIATLPIGYADGYRYQLSNCGEVLIHGRRAPVIGKVCMDFTLVDVTDLPRVAAGDEVVLIGRQRGQWITAEEIAQKTNTISYELLCSIGKRVPRLYRDR
jgi:alanine racemase